MSGHGLQAHIGRRLGSLDLQVALQAEPGESVVLLGPNGAGKSTLLRCLAGLLPLDEGSIELGGAVLDDPGSAVFVEPEHRHVGYVFQDYLLFGHLTVLENVAFGLRARGRDRAQARTEAHRWLTTMGLEAYAHQRPSVLSGGQAQRVALARALATEPHLLLLDEPLAALDAGTRAGVRRELRRHLDEFTGVPLIVTHDPVDAFALADRVVVLDGGRVVQEGTFNEVAARPRSRYVADLVGVNLVSGQVTGGVLTTGSGAAVVIADAPDGPSLAVIRPHSVVLTRGHLAGVSTRNQWSGVVAELDRLGERIRVVTDGPLPLVAEITVGAAEALALRPGDEVHTSVKATDIEVYPA